MVERRRALVHRRAYSLPVLEGLGENVRLADRRGGIESCNAVALDAVGDAGPDEVVLVVDGQNCGVNAPFGCYLGEVGV